MVTASLAVDAARFGEAELTEWFSIVAFGKVGEALTRHQKGDLLAVMGALHRTHFAGRDGEQRQGWGLTVESIDSARTVRPGSQRRPAQPRTTARPFDDDISAVGAAP